VLQIILQLHGLSCKLNVWWDGLNLMNFHHSHDTIPSFKTIIVFGNNYSVAWQPKDTLAILCGNLLCKVILNKLGKCVMALPFHLSRLCYESFNLQKKIRFGGFSIRKALEYPRIACN
jgi:hypothetical protein